MLLSQNDVTTSIEINKQNTKIGNHVLKAQTIRYEDFWLLETYNRFPYCDTCFKAYHVALNKYRRILFKSISTYQLNQKYTKQTMERAFRSWNRSGLLKVTLHEIVEWISRHVNKLSVTLGTYGMLMNLYNVKDTSLSVLQVFSSTNLNIAILKHDTYPKVPFSTSAKFKVFFRILHVK